MRLAACASFGLRGLTGTWYRAVPLKHYRTLLRYQHTAAYPSRFNAGDARNPFPILYFGETPLVALFEARAMVGSPLPDGVAFPNPAAAWVVINVQVQLRRVADLTLNSQRRLLGTTVQELTGDWIGYRLRKPGSPSTAPYTDVPTQRLGAALAATRGIEAFVTYSAQDSRHKNLVVLPNNLRKGSSLTFQNPVRKKSDLTGP